MSEDLQRQLQRQFDLLPDYLGSHMTITVIALGVGLLVSLPLAIAVTKWKPGRWPVLTTAAVIQTIPSLALLALMVPLLGKFGFWPAVIALTLYSMLPILRNTVTGIQGVETAMTEAARGLGMTPLQVLTRVELPLATPVIIAGIRTATVWVVGIATLSTPVGQTSLGNYIFSGLQLRNWTAVLFGCIAAAILAIILDQFIALLESAATRRSRARGITAMAGLAVVIVGGLTAPVWANWFTTASTSPGRQASPAGQSTTRNQFAANQKRTVKIGAKNFSEQYILSALIARRLEQAGFKTQTSQGLGSTVIFDALRRNQLDVYVDYTGTIWANVMKREKTPSAKKVLYIMTGWLDGKYGIRCLGPLGFENSYQLAMRRKEAKKLSITNIADLADKAPQLRFASDQEFLQRPEWDAIRKAYGLHFKSTQNYDPTFMYEAVNQHKADVLPAFSTDGRIAAYHLTLLKDPKHAFPPYDAVLLLSPKAAQNPHIVKALKPLIGTIDNSQMQKANEKVDIKKQSYQQAARWLSKNAVGR